MSRHPDLYERGYQLAESEAALICLDSRHLFEWATGRTYRHHPTRPIPLEGRWPTDVDTLDRRASFAQGFSEGWSATLLARYQYTTQPSERNQPT